MARGSKSSHYSIDAPFAFGVSAVLEGIIVLLLAITLCLVIFRKKVKSRPIWYYYVTMFVLFIGYTLRISAHSMYAYYDKPAVRYYSDDDRYLRMLLSAKRLEPVARLFRYLGAALCSLMLIETGYRHCWRLNERRLLRAGRIIVWVSAAAAGVLALTQCILAEKKIISDLRYVDKQGIPRLDDTFNGDKTAAAVVSAALVVLYAQAMVVLGMVIYALYRAPGKGEMDSVGVYVAYQLLISAIILVVARGWNMAEVGLLLNPYRRARTRDIDWWYWCEIIFDRLGTYLVFVLGYYTGRKTAEACSHVRVGRGIE